MFPLRAGCTMTAPSGMITIQPSLSQVKERGGTIKHFRQYYISVGELFHYPETVTVSSTGGARKKVPSVMGVYKITNRTHSGRPVWQSTVREDRYLFYNGNNIHKYYMI